MSARPPGSARDSATSGAEWEDRYGYRRAVRVGNVIAVSGTTAPGADAYAQARAAFRIDVDALTALGGGPKGRAHREAFGATPPASTMVEVSALIAPDRLVEVEVDAVAAAG